jgi:hypothetical protein
VQTENSRGRLHAARFLGWVASLAAVGSAWPWIEGALGIARGVGRGFAIGAWLAMATLVLGAVAVMINPGSIHPRSRAPVISLLAGVILVSAYAFAISGLAGLANMH